MLFVSVVSVQQIRVWCVNMNYSELALAYAEQYGIITYKVVGHNMIYNKTYRAYLNQPAYTIQHTVDLRTGMSTTKKLGRVMRDGYDNV